MTRKYSLVIEREAGSYSAYVPELRSILVTERGELRRLRKPEDALRTSTGIWKPCDGCRSDSQISSDVLRSKPVIAAMAQIDNPRRFNVIHLCAT